MNFAPYQDVAPERTRALSPPPPRSATASPPPAVGRRALSPSAQASSHMSNHGRDEEASFGLGNSGTSGLGGSVGQQSSNWRSTDGGNGNSGLGDGSDGRGGGGGGGGGRREEVNVFETALGLRMDYEACAAYLALPPAGAVALLVTEQKSDYVRFHAWQSALLFSFLFVIHVIFSWSPIISWLLFIGEIGLIAWLTMRAYRDADTLDRCEVPFFGPLASSILDDE